MHYMIYGAGASGRGALEMLGYDRVEGFVDNAKYGEEYCGKNVISFSDYEKTNNSDSVLVIASEKYHDELEESVKSRGIIRYCVYRDMDIWRLKGILPRYYINHQAETVSYNRILNKNNISKYKKICIYGDNELLHYLFLEIGYQSSLDNIIGIVKTTKSSMYTMGIGEVTLDEIWEEVDCLILNCRRSEDPIFDMLLEREHSFKVISLYDVDSFEDSFKHNELKKYKEIHKGKRIWLIGNGPSMSIADLEVLKAHNEICFGFNKIFRVYNQTSWRANYLCVSDARVMETCIEELQNYEGIFFAADEYNRTTNLYFQNAQYFHFNTEQSYPNYPQFSEDITVETYLGNTSVYDIGLQFAVYMGASEIYIIGVDNNYSKVIMDESNHFIKDNFRPGDEKIYKNAIFEPQKVNRAFERAEKFSREHNIRIYNATRGGKLEAFERVDFDSMFD